MGGGGGGVLTGVRITVTAESHSLRCYWKSTQASAQAVENFNKDCCVPSAITAPASCQRVCSGPWEGCITVWRGNEVWVSFHNWKLPWEIPKLGRSVQNLELWLFSLILLLIFLFVTNAWNPNKHSGILMENRWYRFISSLSPLCVFNTNAGGAIDLGQLRRFADVEFTRSWRFAFHLVHLFLPATDEVCSFWEYYIHSHHGG